MPLFIDERDADSWDGGWGAHKARQRAAWLTATPAQRLQWLEHAIAFAHACGALPRHEGALPRHEGALPRHDNDRTQ